MQQKDKHLRKRYSYGIACVRYKDGKPTIAMISRKFTYAFNAFVCNTGIDQCDDDALRDLFNNMMKEEKEDISNMQHERLWYRLWNTNPPPGLNMATYKNIFHTTFTLTAEKKARLRRLLTNTTSIDRIWEIPKGRKIKGSADGETDVEAAFREFHEETGITRDKYSIVMGWGKKNSYISYTVNDQDKTYITKYYIAVVKPDADVNFLFNPEHEKLEVADVRWMTREDIRAVDQFKRLGPLCDKIFRFARKYGVINPHIDFKRPYINKALSNTGSVDQANQSNQAVLTNQTGQANQTTQSIEASRSNQTKQDEPYSVRNNVSPTYRSNPIYQNWNTGKKMRNSPEN